MSQPFAWIDACVRIAWTCADDLNLHFVYSYARDGVVGDVEVTRERTELFKLDLVDEHSLLERHR